MNLLDYCAKKVCGIDYRETTEEELFEEVKACCYELLMATCAYIGSPQYAEKHDDEDIRRMNEMLRKTGLDISGADMHDLSRSLFQIVSGFILAHIPDEAYKEYFREEVSDD